MRLLKNHYPEFILILITLILFINRGFVAGSDGASSWFSPFYNLKALLFSWATYGGLGDYAPQNFTSFFLRAYYSVFELIFSDPAVIQKLAWICFFGVFGIVIYRGVLHFTTSKFGSIFSVFFCFFNPVALLFLWSKQHWAYYLTVPYILGTYLYEKMITNRDLKYGFYISLLWFLFGFAFNQPAYIGPYFIIIGFLFIFSLFNTEKQGELVVINVKFLCIFLLINSVYFIPLVVGGGEKLDLAISSFAEGDSLPILREFSSVNFAYSFFNVANNTKSIFLGHAFLYFWIIFFVLIFYNSLIKRHGDNGDRRFFLQLIVLLIIFIFLVKGLTPPFSQLSEYIYDNRLMYIFRDFKDKFAIGYATVISFLYILMIKHGNKFTRSYLYILSVVCILLFATNKWLPPAYQYSNSLSYLKDSTILEKKDTSRVLNFPLVDYSFIYTRDPNYYGDSPLKNILHSDVIYGTDFKSNAETMNLRRNILAGTLTNEELDDYLSKHHIRYILNQKNSYVREEIDQDAYDYRSLSQYNSLKLVQDHDNFQVFEYTKPKGLFYADSPVIYTKVNNSTYLVKISGMTDFTNLTFLSKYHGGWSFHLLETGSYLPNCSKFVQQYTDGSRECSGTINFMKKIIPTGPIPYGNIRLSSPSIAYKNIWAMNQSKITDTFSNKYWVTDSDKTITIEGLVYFEPQRVFNISLLISLVTIILMTTYFFKRKQYAFII